MSRLFRPIMAGMLGVLLLAGCIQQPVSRTPAQPIAPPPPRITGVSACDSYLSSYLACHRAAALYPANELPSRYEAMRSNLLHDSTDPHIRPLLAARCGVLSDQLQQALQGKPCTAKRMPDVGGR